MSHFTQSTMYINGITFVEPIFSTSNVVSTYVFSEGGERYLIDPSESTLRSLLGRSGISFNKTRSILITSLDWESIGGLMGVSLTLATFPTPTKIYGPKGLRQLFSISKIFLNIPNIEILEFDDFDSSQLNDDVFKMVTVPIYKDRSKRTNRRAIEQPLSIPMTTIGSLEQPQLIHFNRNKPFEGMSHTFDRDTINCFIGHTKDIKSTFQVLKAKALGVLKQSKYGQLSNGKSVMNDDPIDPMEVHSDQVCDPPQPGASFAYIYCPSEEYFPSLFNHPSWDCIKSGEKPLTVVYHKVPSHILNSPKYVEFMESISWNKSTQQQFTENNQENIELAQQEYQLLNPPKLVETKHLLLDKEFTQQHNTLKSCEAFRNNLKLLVPKLTNTNTTTTTSKWEPTPISSLEQIVKSKILSENVYPADHLIRTSLTPLNIRGDFSKSTDVEQSIPRNDELQHVLEDYFTDSGAGAKLKKSMLELSNQLDESIKGKPKSFKYPKTLFLGTASSIPSEHRNVTGILLTSASNNHMLLDCGESTLTQMERFYGRKVLPDILKNLSLIWVSHHHADHHLGIPSILLEREKVLKEQGITDAKPVVIVAPIPIANWLTNLKKLLIPSLSMNVYPIGKNSNELIEACESMGIVGLANVPVIHCKESYGVVLDFKDGFKLTYSGDTRPCYLLEKAGKDSDLLIHEATFNEDDFQEALNKRHSTLDEALMVSNNMDAKKTIITHFSQRYQTNLFTKMSARPYGCSYDLLQFSPYQADLLYNLKDIINYYNQDLSVAKSKEKEIIFTNLPKTKKPSIFRSKHEEITFKSKLKEILPALQNTSASISPSSSISSFMNQKIQSDNNNNNNLESSTTTQKLNFTTKTRNYNNLLFKDNNNNNNNFINQFTRFNNNNNNSFISIKNILKLKK